MSRLSIAATVFALAIATSAQAAEPISLRDMGSFHVGRRLVAHLAIWISPGGHDERMALTPRVPAFAGTTWQCERAA